MAGSTTIGHFVPCEVGGQVKTQSKKEHSLANVMVFADALSVSAVTRRFGCKRKSHME